MPIEIKMPALSPTMEEGTIAKWLVKEGDTVASGDLIAEIETDKATMEFEAVDEGVIARIAVAEGTDGVKVGTVIAVIAQDGEDASAVASAPTASAQAEEGANGTDDPVQNKSVGSDTTQPKDASNGNNPQTSAQQSAPEKAEAMKVGDSDRVKASPLARAIAEKAGLDLKTLKGSGPRGRIVRADVDTALASSKTATPASSVAAAQSAKTADVVSPKGETDIPHEAIRLSNMRKTIARRLTESKQTVPHYYLTIDCNLDALLSLRGQLNAGLEGRGIKLSVNDLLVKALAVALAEVPDANVQFAGDTLLKFSRSDISMAVAIDGGLITPVITDASNKPLSRIAIEAKDLAARAREGQLKPEEYQGGTASISNLGMYGIKQFDAVINPPQGMILAVGAGEKRPYIVDGELSVATVITATGSFDHRAIDGAVGAELMQAFKRLVEQPIAMLA